MANTLVVCADPAVECRRNAPPSTKVLLTQLKWVHSNGADATYFGTANTMDEARRYAGIGFAKVIFDAAIPLECTQYLQSMIRSAA